MSTDFEQRLAESLRARAGSAPIDPALIRDVAVARGRHLKIRRRIAAAVAAATAVVLIALLGTAALTRNGHRASPVAPVTVPAKGMHTDPYTTDLAKLPPSAVPGASLRPDLIGSDRGVVHFSVDAMASAAWAASWTLSGSAEVAQVQRYDYEVTVVVARDQKSINAAWERPSMNWTAPAPVRIGDLDGTVSIAGWFDKAKPDWLTKHQKAFWSLLWQPAAGVWARATVMTDRLETAVAVAGQVRFDQSRVCPVPFRFGALPAGTVEQTRELSLGTPGFVYSATKLTYADGPRTLQVDAHSVSPDRASWPGVIPWTAEPAALFTPPTDAPWSARLVTGGQVAFATIGIRVWALPDTGGYTAQQVLDTLRSATVSPDLNDPATW
jgi:hypothetical protein